MYGTSFLFKGCWAASILILDNNGYASSHRLNARAWHSFFITRINFNCADYVSDYVRILIPRLSSQILINLTLCTVSLINFKKTLFDHDFHGYPTVVGRNQLDILRPIMGGSFYANFHHKTTHFGLIYLKTDSYIDKLNCCMLKMQVPPKQKK